MNPDNKADCRAYKRVKVVDNESETTNRGMRKSVHSELCVISCGMGLSVIASSKVVALTLKVIVGEGQ